MPARPSRQSGRTRSESGLAAAFAFLATLLSVFLTWLWFAILGWMADCGGGGGWIATGLIGAETDLVALVTGLSWSLAFSELRVASGRPPLGQRGWFTMPLVLMVCSALYLTAQFAAGPSGLESTRHCAIYE